MIKGYLELITNVCISTFGTILGSMTSSMRTARCGASSPAPVVLRKFTNNFTIPLVITVFTVYTNDERQGGVDRGNESNEFQNG